MTVVRDIGPLDIVAVAIGYSAAEIGDFSAVRERQSPETVFFAMRNLPDAAKVSAVKTSNAITSAGQRRLCRFIDINTLVACETVGAEIMADAA